MKGSRNAQKQLKATADHKRKSRVKGTNDAFVMVLSRPLERQNVLPGRALAMPRPSVHKLAPPRQCVRSAVGLLGLVADDVR